MRRCRLLIPLLAAALLAPAVLTAQQPDPLGFPRDPHAHDGKAVFSFRGDLWEVAEDGSDARRLTHLEDARDTRPRYSPSARGSFRIPSP